MLALNFLAHSEMVDSFPIEELEMVRGELVKVLVDYDLFGTNANGLEGIYLKTSSLSKKCLIYFPSIGEWGELDEGCFERLSPGHVTGQNKNFISLVKKLEYSC